MRATTVSWLAVAVLAIGGAACAQSVTLNAKMTVDNQFHAYVSTSPTTAGTEFLSGTNWPTTYTGSSVITSPGTYYLQVLAVDLGSPEMFIGEFSLAGTGGWSGAFSNASTTLLTNATDWVVSDVDFGVSTVAPKDIGPNGTSPWGNFVSIDPSARFLWHPGILDTVYFTAVFEVIPAPASSAVLMALAGVAIRRRR